MAATLQDPALPGLNAEKAALIQVSVEPTEENDAAQPLTSQELPDVLRPLWADILDLDPEDITDGSHFFELGGNSLAAAELVAAVTSEHPSLVFSRVMVFQAPIFADMVSLIALVGTASRLEDGPALQRFSLVDQEDVRLAAEQCGCDLEDLEDVYPVTALQAGLMARSISISGAYVSRWLFRCANSIDAEQLRQMLQHTVQKLPILRTAMAASSYHSFVQVVLPQGLAVQIIRASSLEEAVSEVPQLAIALGAPLMQIRILVVNGSDIPFVSWHAHHAVYDMSTLDLVARHLADIGTGAGVLPPPPSFSSFVSYSMGVRENPEATAFWSQELLGCPASLFPDRGAPLVSTTGQAASPYRTNKVYTHHLPYSDARFGFTTANMFKAAWAYLLSCYERSDDIVFGVTNGGRYAPVPNCAAIVGPMIATAPMRVRTSRSSRVSDFLQQVSVLAARMNDWEQLGLSAIQDLGPDGRQACAFRTLVNVQSANAIRRTQSLMVPEGPDEAEAMEYALVLELFPRDGDKLPIRLTFDNRVLRHDQVTQIASQLEGVVAAFTKNLDARLDRIAQLMDGNITSKEPAASAEIRKLAAVQCGVTGDSIQSISWSTTPQNTFISAFSQRASTSWTQVVFKVQAGSTRDEVVATFETLYQRAPILRTRLVHAGYGRPLQVVVDGTIHWTEALDLKEMMEAEDGSGFAIGRPLTHFALVRGVHPERKVHWVVMTAHAAVFDWTTSHALLGHLNAAAAGADGASSSAFSLAVPAAEDPDSLGRKLKEAHVYWKQTLENSPAPGFPEVPAGHTTLTASHMQKSILLEAKSQPVSLRAFAHAAWALTLSKYQDSRELVFGAGLVQDQNPPVVAPTLAIMPHRVIIEYPDHSVSRFLEGVQGTLTSMVLHSACGLDEIGAINETCASATTFQNLLVVYPESRRSLPDNNGMFSLETENIERNPSPLVWNYAFVIEIIPSGDHGALTVNASYDAAVLEKVQVKRLLAHFEHVLIQLFDSDSSKSLGGIDHVPPSHWDELKVWNDNVPEPLERTVHELFQDRVDIHPREPAICARDCELTYGELDTISEKLSRWLQGLGVGQGSYVPLLFEKCGMAIVAMLAVLKAGGTSVALDPEQPTKRLQGLVAGMGDGVMISSAQNRDLANSLDRRVIVLDANVLRALANRESQPRLSQEKPVSPDTTAFVLFTSGSTGMPKGILIPHKAFASSIRGHGKVLRFTTGPGSRNFQYTAYTSDVHLGEIFTSLALGSCVCVPSDWDRKNDIPGAMRDLNVNWAFFTPSVATLLQPSEVPSLRTLVFGGETASPENFGTWAPSLYLINSFGPAECSIWSHCIPRPVELSDFGSNIGYGVSCATWITDPDDYNKLLPIGAIGELLTEGPNVAAGYLNAPEKTDATFVTNPAWMPADRHSMRIYRSGDLARFLPNGMVQFLGRRDHQVKLNGLRIELGEIEHQIRTYITDNVMVAVDVVNPLPAGSARILTAFVAPKKPTQDADKTARICTTVPVANPEDQKLLALLVDNASDSIQSTLAGLENALRASLPSHMVPAAFVPLREMPLNGSAKIDRKVLKSLASLLPMEELVRLGTTTKSERLQPPATVMERVLARLWAAALRRDLDLDIQDSFFKVGGDSLSAMRLVSLAKRDGITLSVEKILKSPVLQDLAQVAVFTDAQADSDKLPLDVAVAPFTMVGGSEAAKASLLQAAVDQLGIEEHDIEDIYPCTTLQEGLLAVSQDVRGSYVAQMVHEMTSEINYPQFQNAWSSVLDDWPILRTRFFSSLQDDGTVRMMQAVTKLKPRWHRPRSLQDYLKLDARDKMQTGDSMLRLAGFQDKKTQKHYFVMTVHHAVYDGWMLGLLLTAVKRAYAGAPRPAITPYNVFIHRLEARDVEKGRRFWQRYVSGVPRLNWPELPSLDFRPKSNRVQLRTSTLPADCAMASVTPTTWLRTAFSILLGAYSSSDDIVFASTVYGRASGLLSSAERVAGPTLATIPVRVGVGRERLVTELLAEVQADAATMLAYEQEGIQNIRRFNMEALATVDSQSLLVVQVDDANASAPQNLDMEAADALTFKAGAPMGLDNGFLSCALVMEATVSRNSLHLVATHDDKVLSEDQVQRFLRQMTHIVAQLCHHIPPDLRVADLDLAPPEDYEEMAKWNAEVPEPMEALVHELFHLQALEQPEAEALVSWEGSLTFRELDELSTRLAGHLWTSCGVRPGIHVPLIFEKSIWAVVAMLAVLKVGAANVALNPAQPAELLHSLISDVDAEFVLCSEKNLPLTQENFPRHFCVGPAIRADGVLVGENGAGAAITPAHLAFFLFTSGSTGKPKAIMIDHRAFSSSMRGHGEALCYNKGGRNLQFTAYTSDVSIGEIFTSLTRGATVCIPSDEERMNDLAGAMERMRVDWAFLTPSVASLLNPDHVPSLRTLLYGGETATVTNVTTWANRLHLINSFGPAETSIWSHAHPHFTLTDIGSDIGWSLGCATWIVDPDDITRLMPIGAVGELLVEGPNVAAGYYKNPEKTAYAFEQRPPFLREGRRNRIYRMGDLARWMPGGRVQFLGRKDTQVKLHGLKVDVGEVENKIRIALGGEVGIEVAVEMIQNPSDSSDSRLITFMNTTPQGQPQDRINVTLVADDKMLQSFSERTQGLRAKLALALPAFQIPSFFVPLSSMPLNASAKTDRKRLKSIVAEASFAGLSCFSLASRAKVEAPVSQAEKQLHGMWCRVLGLAPEDFGREADFFEYGGDSISAMKMASLARAGRVPLGVQDLYDHPNLCDLARLLEGRADNVPGSLLPDVPAFSLLPLKSVNVELLKVRAAELCGVKPSAVIDAYPLTPTQHSIVQRTLARPGAFWMNNVFEIPEQADVPRIALAWNRVVVAHDVLRTCIIKSHEGQLLQVVTQATDDIMYDDCPSVSIDEFLAAHAKRELQFGQRLTRATLLNNKWFVVTLHHSTYDAWSMDKLFGALETEYARLGENGSAEQEVLREAVRFNHFVSALQGQDEGAAMAFWQDAMQGAVTRHLGRRRAEDSSADRLLRHTIILPTGTTPKGHATHAELAYAAIGLAIHEQTRTPDTVMRLVSTGRALAAVPALEDLLGPTVTSVPLRLRHAEIVTGTTVEALTSHVRQQLRALAPHEHFGFERVAGLLQGEAAAACAAAPQVVVHPFDPYTQRADRSSAMGLQRRGELSVFNDDGAPLTLDVSLVSHGKVLAGFEVRALYAEAVIEEHTVRRLVAVLDVLVKAIAEAPGKTPVDALLRQLDERSVAEIEKSVPLIKKGD